MNELYRKLTGLLRMHHFAKVQSGKGSHEKWQSDITGKTVIVPYNLVRRHTANGILKVAGISEKL